MMKELKLLNMQRRKSFVFKYTVTSFNGNHIESGSMMEFGHSVWNAKKGARKRLKDRLGWSITIKLY